MNAYTLLLAECVTSIFLSLTVLHVLSAPLLNVLRRVCPDEQAATFWMSYTQVMLLITPLLLVLAVDMLTFFVDPLDTWRFALMLSLGGIVLSLYLVGERLGRFIATAQPAREAA